MRPRVLLVNDLPRLRRLKRLRLEGAGYEVSQVVDGLAALEQLRTSPVPLVVVMNTRIPGVDAEGILRSVLAEPALQRHAFVLTTALAPMLPDELGRLTRLLEVPLVAKPFTEQELLAGVDGARRGVRTPRPTGR